MEAQKHTQGPWFGNGEQVAYSNEAMILIYREDGTEIGFFHRREDAALGAAAPDLLEALHLAMPALEWCEKQWAASPQHGEGINVLAVVRAALRKATGESAS